MCDPEYVREWSDDALKLFDKENRYEMRASSVRNQMRTGALISYFNIVLNMVISIFLTPYLISSLGISEYGVYRIVQSFAGQLSMASFGIASLIIRNIVYYDAKGQQKEKENFLFFAKVITYFLAALIVVAGGGMYAVLDSLYCQSLTAEELSVAKRLLIFLIANMSLNIVCDSYTSMITAHEQFAISNASKTLKLVLRILLMVMLLKFGVKSIGIVAMDCAVSAIVLLLVMFYNKLSLKEKAVFHYIDRPLLKQCATFSAAIFLQTVINQVNQNLDNVILGAMMNAATVTMYSLALSLFTTYATLVSTIGGLFSPRATKLVANDATGEEMTDFVIRPGRIQFMIAGLIVTGFILFGKNFILIWVGDAFVEVYPITIILLISSTITMIETTTEELLNAKMKRLGRSLILICMCLINLIVSILCIKRIGYWGAAIGTALSYIVGDGVLINIYLKRALQLNIKRMLISVFRKTIFSIAISYVIGLTIALLPYTYWWFCAKILLYCLLYSVVTYYIGANTEEKLFFKSMLHIQLRRQNG